MHVGKIELTCDTEVLQNTAISFLRHKHKVCIVVGTYHIEAELPLIEVQGSEISLRLSLHFCLLFCRPIFAVVLLRQI